jgi:hypothetical protein
MDFDAIRRDLAAFAEAVGVPLAGFQAKSLRLERRTTAIVACRQLGKSRCGALVGLHRAYAQPEHKVLIVSAGEDASRRVLSECRHIATSSPLLRGSVTDELASVIRLNNGSQILSVPASERRVRGERVDTLILDEAALIPDELILQAALPTTAARPNARVLMLGTALLASGAFYDFATQGLAVSEHITTHRWVPTILGGSEDAWWLSPSALAAARESMSSAAFAAEYLAEFSTGADSLISPAQLDRVTADFEQLDLFSDHGRAGLAAGVDWGGGLGRDRNVIVGIGRLLLPDSTPRYGIALTHAWSRDTQPHKVVQDIARSRLAWSTMAPEANGLGGPLSQIWCGRCVTGRVPWAVGGAGGCSWSTPTSPGRGRSRSTARRAATIPAHGIRRRWRR